MTGEKKAPIFKALALAVLIAAALGLWACDSANQEGPQAGQDQAPGEAAPAQEAVPAEIGPFAVALVTPSDHQNPENLAGVRTVKERHGDFDDGGLIKHMVFPDNFMERLPQTIDLIESAADDPLVKAVVVVEGVPGTAEAFAKIRAKRPEVLLLAAETHEDAALITDAADLVVNSDFIARGYLLVWSAKQMGADTFVHISFPRHMIDESLSRRRAIMEFAALDLGMKFALENALDPIGDEGLSAAEDFIAESVPNWLALYGGQAAFFTTSDGLAPALIKGVADHGGYFVEADEPSPILAYPELFGVDPTPMGSDWPKLLAALDEKVKERGAEGRLGTWTASLTYAHVTSLTELAIEAVKGESALADHDRVLSLYQASSPGAPWRGQSYVNPAYDPFPNFYLVYQDTYVLGRGYLGAEAQEVPARYKAVTMVSGAAYSPPYHIAVVTGDAVQGVDDVLGAAETVRTHGAARFGGLIRHLQYTDEALDDPSLTISLLESLISDPLLKVVVINQAVPGTAEGFRRIKSARPDVWCLAGEPHEDIPEIAASADLTLAADFISRGYLIPYTAKELGADTLVHVSFQRHLDIDSLAIRMKIMEEAAKDLGLKFAQELVPDPAVGLDRAVGYVYEAFPGWLDKYGEKAAFFATNDAQTVPLLRRVAALGGYFVTADIPSTLLGYPDAFNLDLEPYLGDWASILGIIETAVEKAGGAGRMGVWPIPMGYAESKGLAEFGIMLADSQVAISDMDALIRILGHNSPGSRWNGSYLNDLATGKPLRNYFLLYQDVYVFGRGYIHTTGVTIPDKYYDIRLD
ncbi:MAG: DUF3798 domain-containing protein [Deltaproteobacteria bacterium]|jgi:hypothetical protein|nr:DUF3798 domain-containing protein [Deltaproteobacteria bacterium]